MDALDGNAIGGALFEHFGTEMTAASGSCSHCGAANPIARLRVYNRAPGTVVRCPSCGEVVIVLLSAHDTVRADFSYFELHATSRTGGPHSRRLTLASRPPPTELSE